MREVIHDGIHDEIHTGGVYTIFTTLDDTLAAIRIAAGLARSMLVPLTLIHFRAVPRPLSVDKPDGMSPVETRAFVERLRAEGIDAHVRVYLCRDQLRAIPMAFRRHSLIVLAGRRSWWPTRAERWRRRLEASGHFVVFVDRAQQAEGSHA